MKLSAIVTAVAFAGIIGVATAGNAAQAAQASAVKPLTVSQVSARCMRSDRMPNHDCDALYGLIRANFTPREVRTIVAWQASHPEFLFTEMLALRERYVAVLQEYAAAQPAVVAHVAAK